MPPSNLKFYYPLPRYGQSLAKQWPDFRTDFSNLATLIRAAQVDANEKSGEHDLVRWSLGELNFRNRYGIYYNKDSDQLTIQHNTGTESQPIWNDALIIRDSDNRVIAAGTGGFQSTGGFYTPNVPSVIRVQETETGGLSMLADTQAFDSTFFYIQGKRKNTATISFKPDSITLASSGETNTLSSLGGDESLVGTKVGSDLRIKGLTAGSNITLTASGTDVSISSAASGGGGGFYGVLFKESEAGGHIERDDTLVFDSSFFYINPDGSGKPLVSLHSSPTAGAGGGETNTGANLGSGTGVFAQKSGVQLQFKSLTASGGIRLSNTATEIAISQNQFYISDAQDVSKAYPDDNQVLTWDTATGQWGPETTVAGSVTFKETESGGYSSASATVGFDSDFFYLSASSGDGNPIISFSGTKSAFSVNKGEINQASTGSDTTTTWEAKEFDVADDFELANNRFVAPADGLYSMHVHIATTASSVADDNMSIRILINGATAYNGRFTPHANSDIVNININKVMSLNSGDTVSIVHNFNASVVISGNAINTFWSGFRLL